MIFGLLHLKVRDFLVGVCQHGWEKITVSILRTYHLLPFHDKWRLLKGRRNLWKRLQGLLSRSRWVCRRIMELEAPSQWKELIETNWDTKFLSSSTISIRRKESCILVEELYENIVIHLLNEIPLLTIEDVKHSKYCPYDRRVRHALEQCCSFRRIFIEQEKSWWDTFLGWWH